MISVIVLSSACEKKILTCIKNLLGEKYSIASIDEKTYCDNGQNTNFIIIKSSTITNVKAKSIVVFKDSTALCENINLDENCIAIANSDDQNIIKYLAANNIKAITCGLSTKDTLTLSSITQDSAVISLQRAITTIYGSTLEPFEMPVKLQSKLEPYSILIIAAITIITDNAELLKSAL